MEKDYAIQVQDLWKRYGVVMPRWYNTIHNRFRKAIHKPAITDDSYTWALKGVSFEVEPGETFGIIGRNGAGKSTLLKILAGVTPPTKGSVLTSGKIFPMIELNAGLHMDLSGRENVRLLGALMGLSSGEIKSHIEEIEDFCELGEWFDRPVRHYSSGMFARLGFSVGINVNAEILIVDEVLSVGDIFFQKKCFNKIEQLRNEGVTTLYVSHSVRSVERLCENAMLLNYGSVELFDKSSSVIKFYLNQLNANNKKTASIQEHFQGTGDLVVTNVEIFDEFWKKGKNIQIGRPMTIRIHFTANSRIIKPIFGIAFQTEDFSVIAGITNDNYSHSPSFEGTDYYDLHLFEIPFTPGVYSIRLKILYQQGNILYANDNAGEFRVIPDGEYNQLNYVGFFKLRGTWDKNEEIKNES